MILIVAADNQFGIGKNNDLLTYLPEDLAFFKEQTLNKTIVIGRKTLESFKNGKPLPKRQHIVLSRTKTYDHERIQTVQSVEALLEVVKTMPKDEVFVAGGGSIYAALLPYCHKAYITRIEADLGADTFMPNFEQLEDWTCVDEGEVIKEGNLSYRHTTWERKL